ncbi:MAG: hypothetical protein M1285_05535 [Candidatus Thermoplasmatota archaeon]|nr:hypothetical protein [Candidatus Thermoplasmatota archaeon]
MKGYGSIREIKTSKLVSVVKDKGVEEYEQYDATYGWKDLDGEITLSMVTSSGKKLTLLKLSEAMYRKLTLTVRSDDEIEEIVQKQLNVQEDSNPADDDDEDSDEQEEKQEA